MNRSYRPSSYTMDELERLAWVEGRADHPEIAHLIDCGQDFDDDDDAPFTQELDLTDITSSLEQLRVLVEQLPEGDRRNLMRCRLQEVADFIEEVRLADGYVLDVYGPATQDAQATVIAAAATFSQNLAQFMRAAGPSTGHAHG